MSLRESGDLRVTTTHLNELSSRQASAADELRSATLAVEGVDTAVRNTHGGIASATADALSDAMAARRSAATAMAVASDELGRGLAHAADLYDDTDDAMGHTLDGQVRLA
ncbi:type VII secretion target [Mycolicibacterium moriokaense]|uniref:type VII secretion target n=1 Tax=Mycolicibacterium moriokaense TaxID=39691 RepID=UPI000DA1BE03|nr:type VII secretion target [Mycolicibacterium moriokaense]